MKLKPKAPRLPSKRARRTSIRGSVNSVLVTTQDSAATNGPPPVINLSTSKVITEGHFGIFTKGPKFVPTPPKANFAEFHEDFQLWKNKLRWAYYHEKMKLNR